MSRVFHLDNAELVTPKGKEADPIDTETVRPRNRDLGGIRRGIIHRTRQRDRGLEIVERTVHEGLGHDDLAMPDVTDPQRDLARGEERFFDDKSLPHLIALMGDDVLAVANDDQHREDGDA